MQEDEQCDDGAANSNEAGAACRTNCRLPFCGDGVVGPGEACDLAGLNSDAAGSDCLTTCTRAMLIVHEAMTHDQAVARCADQGMQLARIDSDAKRQEAIELNVETLTLNIDGTDSHSEGNWVYLDGTPLTYFHWNSGEPNNSGDEDVIEMFGADGLWNDNRASSAGGYPLCE